MKFMCFDILEFDTDMNAGQVMTKAKSIPNLICVDMMEMYSRIHISTSRLIVNNTAQDTFTFDFTNITPQGKIKKVTYTDTKNQGIKYGHVLYEKHSLFKDTFNPIKK
jgi:hypothetical protein